MSATGVLIWEKCWRRKEFMQQQQGGQHIHRKVCVTFVKPASYLWHGQVVWDELAQSCVNITTSPHQAELRPGLQVWKWVFRGSCCQGRWGNAGCDVLPRGCRGNQSIILFPFWFLFPPLRFLVLRKSTSKHSPHPSPLPAQGAASVVCLGGWGVRVGRKKKKIIWKKTKLSLCSTSSGKHCVFA